MIREMIRFSQCLQDVLASTGWKQKEFAGRAGVSATNVSRWLGRKALPDRVALGKVVHALPVELAAGLVAAWVFDSLPENASRLVDVVSIGPNLRFRESPDEWPTGLNRASRRKFIDFSRLAMKHPDVMTIVDVLHTAAMRVGSDAGKAGSGSDEGQP